MVADYPSAERQSSKLFAFHFTKALFSSDAIRIAGRDAVLFAAFIASREDHLRYRSAPRFWRAEIMDRFGIRSPKDFIRIRNRAIEEGLLHFEEGNRITPASYWVLVPDWLRDHVFPFPNGNSKSNEAGSTRSQKGTTSGTDVGTDQGTDVGTHSIPNPNPVPKPEKKDAGASPAPRELMKFLEEWNQVAPTFDLPKVKTDPVGRTILRHWKAAWEEPEFREVFAARGDLGRTIREATWARSADWFRLPDLLTNNKTGERKLAKLLRGGYRGELQRSTNGQAARPKFDVEKALAGVTDD